MDSLSFRLAWYCTIRVDLFPHTVILLKSIKQHELGEQGTSKTTSKSTAATDTNIETATSEQSSEVSSRIHVHDIVALILLTAMLLR